MGGVGARMLARVDAWTPAQLAALAFGVWWIGNGLAVFLASEASLAAPGAHGTVDALGVAIAVNGWHGLFHLATGIVGVAVCRRPRSAAAYVLIVGPLYLLAALYALFVGDSVFGLIRVDELGSLDHAVEGVLLLAAWRASRSAARPRIACGGGGNRHRGVVGDGREAADPARGKRA